MLKLSHVKKTFNKGTVTEKRALTGVDLTLNDGDFVTVIGGNGAGKSTLLNMIAGVYPLDSGVIELDGTDISRLSESQRAKYLGRVFQDPMRGTAADMQIAENLALAKRRGQRRGLSWGVTKAEKDEYVELLKRLDLGLDTRLNAKVGLLSGGQRQALTLLMATLTKPRLLLLDEHTAALDPKTASKVLNLTEEIVDEHHLTTLMVTHNMNDAIRLGNRLIMMHEGHVIYDVAGDEKKSLTVADLLQKFEEVSGGQRQALTLLMATLTRPRLLLLDEHTAALDPKTASKVLNLTEEIVDENHLTTLMVTHNMNDAIRLGNRLIMMHEGHVIYDVAGDEKKSLTVADLLQKFEEVSGGELANDRMLLS